MQAPGQRAPHLTMFADDAAARAEEAHHSPCLCGEQSTPSKFDAICPPSPETPSCRTVVNWSWSVRRDDTGLMFLSNCSVTRFWTGLRRGGVERPHSRGARGAPACGAEHGRAHAPDLVMPRYGAAVADLRTSTHGGALAERGFVFALGLQAAPALRAPTQRRGVHRRIPQSDRAPRQAGSP